MSEQEQKGWSAEKCDAWYGQQPQVRDYQADIYERARSASLPPSLILSSYGYAHDDCLICVEPRQINGAKPSLIITGGVHGYEPGGIEACLRLIETGVPEIRNQANIFIYPCVTPAAYRINHRWTVGADDTNRGFIENSPVVEAALLMERIKKLNVSFVMALDCHETPPADRQFRRQRAERYGTPLIGDPDLLPNGFHLMVPDSALLRRSVQECARAIIKDVRKITPVATDEKIVGNVNDGGIVPSTASGTLTRWMNDRARFAATTEVVTEKMTLQQASDVQLAAIRSAAGYALRVA